VFRQGGRLHTLVILADVSRLVRGEERQAWKDIIRVLTHEIHNSLAPIASISQGLHATLVKSAPIAPADFASGLAVISRRAESLRRFMDNYGRLARLPPPVLGTIDVDPWLRRVARLEDRVPISLRGPANVALEADEGLLEQALINLLRNAADASAGEGSAIDIAWTIDERRELTIRIVDAGPGIAAGATLFVPFFSTKPEGSGIGLVLSREIVESHGGRLALENRRGERGSVATVVLPRATSRRALASDAR
jgi:nitrogen fixation/metabolism regulation signal transduction histidine kinase